MKRKYIQLEVSEILTLESGYKYGSQYPFRHRYPCLLLSHQGQSVQELAAIFQVSKLTIYKFRFSGGVFGSFLPIPHQTHRVGHGQRPHSLQ